MKAKDRFFVSDDGIIEDVLEKLFWVVGPDKNMSFNQARAWASNLTTRGLKWRLPTIKELQSLLDLENKPSNIYKIFKLSAWYVWSGQEQGPTTAWAYFFTHEAEDWSTKSASHGFRAIAVRNSDKPD
ncbi:MAG: DUF1566 domain-containing protein [Deltaproteobacteria bacterium]|nr:DUF1566 domain-containing protein [Deltaproteobacteria bacterium]